MNQELRIRIRICVEKDDDRYYAYCPELKGVHEDGDSVEAAIKNAKEAALVYIQSILEHNKPLPQLVHAPFYQTMNERKGTVLRCLSLDLEVGVKHQRIHAFAAVRSDTGQSLQVVTVTRHDNPADALAKLDELAAGADCLLGHNLIAHDLPHLRAAAPELRLLRLPPLDTLCLSPLAFPRNPYHRLARISHQGMR